MSIIRPFRFRAKKSPVPEAAREVAERLSERGISDDQALQELIDILKKPYQCNCDKCWGRGAHPRTGRACEHCQGTGRILMDLL